MLCFYVKLKTPRKKLLYFFSNFFLYIFSKERNSSKLINHKSIMDHKSMMYHKTEISEKFIQKNYILSK